MATALPHNTNLECPICLESFTIPKILICGHSFCRECLVRYIDGRKRKIPCPVCQTNVKIPRGGVDKFITNFDLQTSTDFPRTTDISTTPPSKSLKPKHYCPNHSKKEVEYYCLTCSLGLCSKCVLIDHVNHAKLDLECDSTREMLVQKLSKSSQIIQLKIKDLEKTSVTLLETSKQLKSFCDEACTKINETTEKIIGELKENCEKIHNEIRDHFDTNESKLTGSRQKVMAQIRNIKTDLDTFCPTTTEEPSLTLIYSQNKLQDLQKLYEDMKTDIPPVTYVEWREGSVKVCDMFGSTVTKPLDQSREGNGPISTVTKPLDQSSEDSGPISTVTKPLDQSSEGSVPISTVTKPLYQYREGSGPISTVTKPLDQSSEGSGPISTVTKPLYQSSEGSGPISTVTKPLYQSSEGSGPISTVTKPLDQSSEGSRPISTVTKPLHVYQSSEGSGPISTVTKPIYPSSEGSGPISTVTKPLYQYIEGGVFRFNYKDNQVAEWNFSKDKCTSHGMVWGCVVLSNMYYGYLHIRIGLLPEDNPRLENCSIKIIVTLLSTNKDKNISKTITSICEPGYLNVGIDIPWYKLTDPSEGFIDIEGQFLVRLEVLQVLDVVYKK